MILFILATLGMAFIIVESSLFEPIRKYVDANMPAKFGKLVNCLQCSGFWCGVAMGWLLMTDDVYKLFAYGCAGSFVSMFGGIILHKIEEAPIETAD